MDAFWCIVLSVIVLRWWWKRNRPEQEELPPEPIKLDPELVKKFEEDRKITKIEMEVQDQKDRDIAELKKQGYSDELIAVILPTINDK